MKLRIRSLETNTTHKIQVPNTCTLPQLKQSIINLDHTSPPPPPSSSSLIFLSLNKKDELYGGPSPHEVSIQSLGITSGDLIYFSFDPFAFSSRKPDLNDAQMEKSLEFEGLNDAQMDKTLEFDRLNDTQMDTTLEFEKLDDTKMGEFVNLDENVVSDKNQDFGGTQMDKTLEFKELNDTHKGEFDNFGENVVSDKKQDFGGTQMDKTLDFKELNDTKMGEFVNLGENVVGSDKNQDFGGTQMGKLSEFTKTDDKSGDFGEFIDTQMEKSVQKCDPDGKSGSLGDFDGLKTVGTLKSSYPNDQSADFVDRKCNPGDENPCLVDFEGLENVGTSKLIEGTDGVGEMEVDDKLVLESGVKFSVPSFLKKVLVKEVGDVANGGDHKLLVIAVHAVLMESGFVSYDPISGMKIDGFHLFDEWPSSSFGLSLHYTLPEIALSEVVDTIIVKFQMLGKYINVYGSLPKKGFRVHRVCLDEPRFVSALNLVWKMSDTNSNEGNTEPMKLSPFKEIFEFWKIVKDGLSYPLLIELCEKTGLTSPSCLMCLPTELKFKILESVSAIDVAKVGSTCSELRFLCSNNDLWKLKYEEEFGNAISSQGECQWKAKFASSWETRKKRKRMCIPYPFREPRLFNPIFPGRRTRNPRGNPFVIGGDYDRLPALGWRDMRGSGFGGFGL